MTPPKSEMFSSAADTCVAPSVDATPRSDESPVGMYLTQIRVFPLIDAAQERAVAQRLAHARGKFRRLVLSTDHGLRQALALLRAVHERTERFDRIIDVAVRDKAKKQKLSSDIADQLPTIAALVEGTQRGHDLSPHGHGAESGSSCRRRSRAGRRQAVALIEALCLRTIHFERWWQEIARDHGAIASRRRQRIQSVRRAYLDAKRSLATHNLRLVISVAKRYRNHGLTFSDLVQEGNVGLLIAADKFDSSLGHRFSTYATWWIMQMIRKAIVDKSPMVRLPLAAVERIDRAQVQADQLQQSYGRQLTQEEIDLASALTRDERWWICSSTMPTVSLDQPIPQHNDFLPGESLTQRREASPDEAAKREEIRAKVLDVLSRWEPREREIIKLRFGLGNLKTHTLEEVGLALSLSRERVRQLEKASLQRLREQLASIQHVLA